MCKSSSRYQFLFRVFVLMVVSLIVGCRSLTNNYKREFDVSGRKRVEKGLLYETYQDVMKDVTNSECSAFFPISKNSDALKWRLALIDEAKHSIDIQVFIWTDDESGRLVLSRVLAAAERGVKVRLLIDDLEKDWPDKFTSLVSHKDNISIHRFNPSTVRSGIIYKSLSSLVQFRSLNRRMHNKQIIVDNTWAIVGGRNIGNPYFGLSKKYNNIDFDILTTGPIVDELITDFDDYWNAEAAYPGRYMYKKLSDKKTKKYFVSLMN